MKRAVLLGLYQLAKAGPHLWPAKCVQEAIQVARTTTNLGVTSLALDVFIVLTKSPVICHEYVEQGNDPN